MGLQIRYCRGMVGTRVQSEQVQLCGSTICLQRRPLHGIWMALQRLLAGTGAQTCCAVVI